MKKPNLFIVGAPKSGSSFLYEKLEQHKELYFTTTKELNFFSYQELEEKSYYKDFKIKDLSKYLQLFEKSKQQKYLIDASVSYFVYPTVPNKLKDFNSNAKIIMILREPVKRAFSHYLMDIRMGYANKSLVDYLSNPEKYQAYYTQYIGNSLYSKNIKNYTDVFGKENVCILKLENLKQELSKLFNFLGVEDITNEIKINSKVNPNKEAKNSFARFFQRNRNITEKLKLLIPKFVINIANKILYGKPKRVEMNQEEKTILNKLLKEEIIFYKNIL